MKINTKISLQQFLPLFEAEVQGLLHSAQANLAIFFLRCFSLCSCPQHGLKVKVLLLLNAMHSTVNSCFHISSELTVTGLARVYCSLHICM
jgi:hypothetical protein